MQDWLAAGGMGLGLCGFGLAVVSALFPWVNGEVVLLSLSSLARNRSDLVALVLLTSAGQMAGKCLLYWAGRGAIRIKPPEPGGRMARWKQKLAHSPARSLAIVFVSSAAGIPPFYLITILAGTLRLPFGSFVGVGLCGRIVRFGLLVLLPQLALGIIFGGPGG